MPSVYRELSFTLRKFVTDVEYAYNSVEAAETDAQSVDFSSGSSSADAEYVFKITIRFDEESGSYKASSGAASNNDTEGDAFCTSFTIANGSGDYPSNGNSEALIFSGDSNSRNDFNTSTNSFEFDTLNTEGSLTYGSFVSGSNVPLPSTFFTSVIKNSGVYKGKNVSGNSWVQVSQPTLEITYGEDNSYHININETSGSGSFVLLTSDSGIGDDTKNVMYSTFQFGSGSGYGFTAYSIKQESSSMTNSSGPNCVDENTLITCLGPCLYDIDVPVKNLRPGDIVKSFKRGYRRIKHIGFMTSFTKSDSEETGDARYVLKKTEENGLLEDLYVAAKHLIPVKTMTQEQEIKELQTFGKVKKLEDMFLIQARHHPDFEKVESNQTNKYYQMALENDGNRHKRYGIYTNGYVTESTSYHDYRTHLSNLTDVKED